MFFLLLFPKIFTRNYLLFPKYFLYLWESCKVSTGASFTSTRFRASIPWQSIDAPKTNTGQIADGKDRTLGQIAQKWDVPNKRTPKGSLYYLKKTAGIGQKCKTAYLHVLKSYLHGASH